MATDCFGSPPPSSPSPTKPTTPSNRTPPLPQRLQNGACFNCGNIGHWASNCPFKTPSQSKSQYPKTCPPSSSSSPPLYDTSRFASIPCPNGHGSIPVRISGTKENPGRPFYSCSKGYCKFFKWYDQVVVESESSGDPGGSSSKAKHDRAQDRNPECPCGAGKCKVVFESKGEFFVCPIQKGHGACSFRRGVDDTLPTKTVTTDVTQGSQVCDLSPKTTSTVMSNLLEGGQVSHLPLKRPSTVMSDLTEGRQGRHPSPKRTKFESPVMNNPDPLPTPVGDNSRIEEIVTENNDYDDILDMSIIEETVRKEAELESLQLSRLAPEVVRHRQVEFMRQIAASEDATVADPIRQLLGTLITGWLGRLAFPPSGGLVVPQAKPFFCCIFPSFDPISVPKGVDAFSSGNINDQPHTPLNAEPESSMQILSQDSQSGVLLELASIQSVPGIRQGRDFTGQIMKALFELGSHVQNQLLTILESTEPCNHKSMTEAANKTFSVLNSLSVDQRSFSEQVRKFISCASFLAEIESMMVGQSSEMIMMSYDDERANLNRITRMQAETLYAVTASEKRLKSLGEEASRLKEELLQIEDQLRLCEKENAELKIQSRKVSEDMIESEKKLKEAEAAKKLREEREKERNAAKESLERARIQLRQSVIMV